MSVQWKGSLQVEGADQIQERRIFGREDRERSAVNEFKWAKESRSSLSVECELSMRGNEVDENKKRTKMNEMNVMKSRTVDRHHDHSPTHSHSHTTKTREGKSTRNRVYQGIDRCSQSQKTAGFLIHLQHPLVECHPGSHVLPVGM